MTAGEHAAWEYALVRVVVFLRRLDDAHEYAVIGRDRFRQKLVESGEVDDVDWLITEFDERTRPPAAPYRF